MTSQHRARLCRQVGFFAAVLQNVAGYCGFPTEAVSPLFTRHTFSVTSPNASIAEVSYRLHSPPDVTGGLSERLYPLVVWLHGYGEHEMSCVNEGQLLHLDNVFLWSAESKHRDFYMLAMQLPKQLRGWYPPDGKTDGHDALDILKDLIEYLVSTRNVDQHAVTLTGCSGGASGCWELAMRHPDMFAAIAPIASGPFDHTRVHALQNVPVWAFHVKNDPVASIRPVSAAVSKLSSMGDTAVLTELPGYSHDVWRTALVEHDVVRWLAARKIGISCPPPGFRSAYMSPYELALLISGILTFVYVLKLCRDAYGHLGK